jgi:competence protein ComEA
MRTVELRAALGAAALVLLTLAPAWGQTGAKGVAPGAGLSGVVNVNTATPDELQLLPGVGPSRARAIVEYRTQHGAFEKVEELLGVRGIGEKALEQMRPHVALSGKTTAQAKDDKSEP